MTLKHILFDFDGTLIDSAPCILNCYQQALTELEIEPAVPVKADIIGPPLQETVAMLAATDDATLISDLASRFKHCYDQRVATETPLYADVEEVLSDLKKRGYQLYIATNKRHLPTMAVLRHLGLTGYFTAIGSVDQMPAGQQKKGLLIRELMMQHNILADDAIYVGDKLDDYEAASFNALQFAAAGWGYGEWSAEAEHPVLGTAHDILSFVDGDHVS